MNWRTTTVSIGIPTLNGPDRLDRLLRSISERTAYPGPKLLTVCDDCSTEANQIRNRALVDTYYPDLRHSMNLRLLQNETRSGIAKTWNNLVREMPATVHVLLNDDVEVEHDWLDVLVYSAMMNPRLGMVGLDSYIALTRNQHFKALGVSAAFPEHALKPRPDYVEAHLMHGGHNLLSSNGSAFAFRRAAYEEAGGFDERYFCYYEELDFGVTLRKKGYTHTIATHPVLYHMGGATNSDRSNLDSGVELQKSRELFRAKWGKTPAELREQFSEELATMKYLSPDWPRTLHEWNSTYGRVEE